jgi:hypothetical protein
LHAVGIGFEKVADGQIHLEFSPDWFIRF